MFENVWVEIFKYNSSTCIIINFRYLTRSRDRHIIREYISTPEVARRMRNDMDEDCNIGNCSGLHGRSTVYNDALAVAAGKQSVIKDGTARQRRIGPIRSRPRR